MKVLVCRYVEVIEVRGIIRVWSIVTRMDIRGSSGNKGVFLYSHLSLIEMDRYLRYDARE